MKIIITESQLLYIGENINTAVKAIQSGLLVHGGQTKLDKIDLSYVKGGFRGNYGYGIYFTDSPYKAKDYGDVFTYLDPSKLNILDIRQRLTQDFVDKLSQVRIDSDFNMFNSLVESFSEYLEKLLVRDFTIHDAVLTVFEKFPSSIEKSWTRMLKHMGYDGVNYGYEYVIFNEKKGTESLVDFIED